MYSSWLFSSPKVLPYKTCISKYHMYLLRYLIYNTHKTGTTSSGIFFFFLFDLVCVSEIETLAPEHKVWSQLCLALHCGAFMCFFGHAESSLAYECPHEQNSPVLLHLAFSHTGKFLNAQEATFSSCGTDNTKKYRCLRMLMSMDVSVFSLCHLWHGNIKVIFTKNGGVRD